MTPLKQNGFTLIEMVIVVAIMTLLIGIAAPSLSGLMNSEKDSAAESELEALAQATLTFTEDTKKRPRNLDSLYDSNVPGFGGPYIDDLIGGRDVNGQGYRYDPWKKKYRMKTVGRTKIIFTSAGQDGRFGTADDISREVDVRPVLRRISLENLAILNLAVSSYNQTNLKTAPLSQSVSTAQSTLVNGGYLPRGVDFSKDAFGDRYVSSGSPVVQFSSRNFGTPGSGSNSSGAGR